ncbi:MAG: ATP-dependent DNA/RNA helicase [Cirrosporium novae-zelandiae]|nr:MAG: ATP-dependent DNA/RNA helicase [Cirrosporium novae-zelandiae]
MKRKLVDREDASQEAIKSQPEKTSGFPSFGLDPRLLQAIKHEKYSKPTPVQSLVVPLALEGKDILARARTGSGKTAAYVLPILNSILRRKATSSALKQISALVLVPTKDLAEQVYKVISTFSSFCGKDIRVVNLLKTPNAARALLADCPDVVIATPTGVSNNINSSALSLEHLAHLVIDEADNVLEFEYEDDLRSIATSIPKGVQSFLVSATLTTNIDTLKGLFCQDPAVAEVDERDDEGEVLQYIIKCAEKEKFLLLFLILRLKLIQGKFIIFVQNIDRCYRLKLYLEQFGIKSCVLNSELPINTRVHVVEEFNKNIYDIIIASDEHEAIRGGADLTRENKATKTSNSMKDSQKLKIKKSEESKAMEIENGEVGSDSESKNIQMPPRKKKKATKQDKEYGLSRGIDFQNVACVLNFDLPTTSKSYTHRIGRTARAGKTGIALSFVIPVKEYRRHPPTSVPSTKNDEVVLAKITKHQSKKGRKVEPYQIDMEQAKAFEYRIDDALRAVTSTAIQAARTRELRQEILKSEKLKQYFEENPEDLHHLRHDGELRAARIQPHMKHVPDYLLPSNGGNGLVKKDVGYVGIRKTSENRIRRARAHNRIKGKGRGGIKKKTDPLKTFNAKGRR